MDRSNDPDVHPLLTNAVHPRGKGNAIALRSKVATEVAAALALNPTGRDATLEEHHRIQRSPERGAANEFAEWQREDQY